MMFSPATPNLEAPSPGQFVSTASTCSHTIRSSAASTSCLAVRRMPTTPSVTCGRSQGTITTFCYQIISKIGPRTCRQEFFRIQSDFADIIHQDVLHTLGQFYLRYQPSNNEIDGMLQMQGDNDRDFMTITTDGGFIHALVPSVESTVVMLCVVLKH